LLPVGCGRALARGPAAVEPEWRLRLLGDTDALVQMRNRIEQRDANPAWLQAKGRVPAPDSVPHELFDEALHPSARS
jgi:hypothetical protein